MPAFDLRYLQVAEYKKKTDGEGTEYGTPVSMGDAMTVGLEMRFAEGRIYAEAVLAEYPKLTDAERTELLVQLAA